MTLVARSKSVTGREWGDFQTPPALARQICQLLAQKGIKPKILLEPTCGTGNFIKAALETFPSLEHIYGVEVQPDHLQTLRSNITAYLRPDQTIDPVQANIFNYTFPSALIKSSDLLILGNPPWVTNAELGSLESDNLPFKNNLKNLPGLSAKTGQSNFDLAEAIILRLLKTFTGRSGTLAMLCKNTVIKNLVAALPGLNVNLNSLEAYSIDAEREFGAAVEASLLVAQFGGSNRTMVCRVAELKYPGQIDRTFGWYNGRFVSDVERYKLTGDVDGISSLVWRQGIKHDCAKVMELDTTSTGLLNGNGERVAVEENWIYPLLKGSDLKGFEVQSGRKRLIVPQQRIGASTFQLAETAPNLWHYLISNSAALDGRKSSIYEGKPRFSIFGVGDYSFKPYKVAIASLYKHPHFCLVPPIQNRPVMLDDTCYFLGFDDYQTALFTVSVLNSKVVNDFLQSVIFLDAKRPYTKEVLMRINLSRAAESLSWLDLQNYWDSVAYVPKTQLDQRDFEVYKAWLSTGMRQSIQKQLSFDL